jgi:hypothetical protein
MPHPRPTVHGDDRSVDVARVRPGRVRALQQRGRVDRLWIGDIAGNTEKAMTDRRSTMGHRHSVTIAGQPLTNRPANAAISTGHQNRARRQGRRHRATPRSATESRNHPQIRATELPSGRRTFGIRSPHGRGAPRCEPARRRACTARQRDCICRSTCGQARFRFFGDFDPRL